MTLFFGLVVCAYVYVANMSLMLIGRLPCWGRCLVDARISSLMLATDETKYVRIDGHVIKCCLACHRNTSSGAVVLVRPSWMGESYVCRARSKTTLI